MPIYRDAGFELFDAETTKNAFSRETENERIPDLYIYSRYRNPTVIAAEEEIMKLEGCRWALLTQSGMSAIDTAVSVFQKYRIDKTMAVFQRNLRRDNLIYRFGAEKKKRTKNSQLLSFR